MAQTLFDKNGEAVALLSEDHNRTIFLWDGRPAAYLYEDRHVYGFNGRHLGWFVQGVLFDHDGRRAGFTKKTCPVNTVQATAHAETRPPDDIRPRWEAPPFPNLSDAVATRGLADLFAEGITASLPA